MKNVNKRPLVSVLISAFNEEKVIIRCINSVLSQTYQDLEILVVDDGSSDRTAAEVDRIADKRIRILKKENSGLVDSLNLGIRCASGEFIARLDADDEASPLRIEAQVDSMESDPSLVLSGTWAFEIVENNVKVMAVPVGDSAIRKQLYRSNPFIHSSVMFRAGPAKTLIGGYPSIYPCEDYMMWIKMATCGRLSNLKKPLVNRYTLANHVNSRPFYKGLTTRKYWTAYARCQLNAHKLLGIKPAEFPFLGATSVRWVLGF